MRDVAGTILAMVKSENSPGMEGLKQIGVDTRSVRPHRTITARDPETCVS